MREGKATAVVPIIPYRRPTCKRDGGVFRVLFNLSLFPMGENPINAFKRFLLCKMTIIFVVFNKITKISKNTLKCNLNNVIMITPLKFINGKDLL